MIRVEINDRIRNLVQNYLLIDHIVTNKRSIISDNKLSNLIGKIGEVIFETSFPFSVKHNVYDFDYMLNGEKIDIKTSSISSEPTKNREVFIPTYTLDFQKCDRYVFVKLLADHNIAWIVGTCTKEFFLKNSECRKKSENCKKQYVDLNFLKISKLEDPTEFLYKTHADLNTFI